MKLYSIHKIGAAPCPHTLYRTIDAAQEALRHYARPEAYTITRADVVVPVYDGNPGLNFRAGCAVNALLNPGEEFAAQWPGEFGEHLAETCDGFGTRAESRTGVLNALRAAGHQSAVYGSGEYQCLVIFTAK